MPPRLNKLSSAQIYTLMEIIYNSRDLLRVFLEYHPITHVPLVHKEEIKQFISKKRISKLQSNIDFLDTPISSVLMEFYEDISVDRFFQDVTAQNLARIPIIQSENFTLTSCLLKEFQILFKPITKLDNFNTIFDNINISLFIINSKYQLIYQNQECKSLFSQWEDKIENDEFDFISFFLETVSNKVNQLDNEKIHHLFVEEEYLRISFKLKEIQLNEGNLFVFSILTIADDK